jgi:hypothetical protein
MKSFLSCCLLVLGTFSANAQTSGPARVERELRLIRSQIFLESSDAVRLFDSIFLAPTEVIQRAQSHGEFLTVFPSYGRTVGYYVSSDDGVTGAYLRIFCTKYESGNGNCIVHFTHSLAPSIDGTRTFEASLDGGGWFGSNSMCDAMFASHRDGFTSADGRLVIECYHGAEGGAFAAVRYTEQ